MLKAIQIVVVTWLLAVSSYVLADDCEGNTCFGLNWKIVTEEDMNANAKQ